MIDTKFLNETLKKTIKDVMMTTVNFKNINNILIN